MDNQTFQKIKELLGKHTEIGVILSKNPSFDEMAAGLGLYLSLVQMEKNSIIVSALAPTVEFSSLVGINKLQNSMGGQGGDLTVSFPYKEGEIEKVSYTLDGGFLNIQVKAGNKGLSFTNQDVAFKRSGKMPSLLFVLGSESLADTGILTIDMLTGITVVNIDNKSTNQNFGDVLVVSPKFSSVSEQVADFLTLLEPQININIDSAQNLLSGIIFATKDLTDSKTSYLALEMSGILMRKGAIRQNKIGGSQGRDAMNTFFPQPQPVTQTVQQPIAVSQPVMQPQPVQQQAPIEQPKDINPAQAPADWLAPKVYKGSTIL